jgi:hypothetical protein
MTIGDLEYRFDDLSIDVDGGAFGHFDGAAFLIPDRGGGFFVAAPMWLRDVNDVQVAIYRGGSPLAVELFRAIEAAIDASTRARDAWAAHCESERADAA